MSWKIEMREGGLFPGATCWDNGTQELEPKQQQGLGAAGGAAGAGTGGFLSVISILMWLVGSTQQRFITSVG